MDDSQTETGRLLISTETNENETRFDIIKTEFWEILKITLPLILSNIFIETITTEATIFGGRISKYHLDGVSLGISMLYMFCNSLSLGFTTACDTYFSQIYGSNQKSMMGLMLQRSIIMATFIPPIVIAVLINLQPILILIGQDPYVSIITKEYLTTLSPGVFFMFYYLILMRFMQSQNRSLPPFIVGVIANLTNIVLQLIFVYYLDYGVSGVGACQAVTYLVFTVLETIAIFSSKNFSETWTGFTRDAFVNWKEFLKLAAIGSLMFFAQDFCFEVNAILAGIMGPVDQAVMTIITQTENFLYLFSLGSAIAVNIRVGHALGSNKPKRAKLAYNCGLVFYSIMWVINTTIYLIIQKYIPLIYTNDTEVIEKALEIIPYMVLVQIVDGLMVVHYGALRGCGLQKLCIIIVLLGLYLIGLPLGIVSAFVFKLKVKGIWIGLFVCMALQLPGTFFYMNFVMDWQKQADLASQRVKAATVVFSDENQITDFDPKTHRTRSSVDIRMSRSSQTVIIETKNLSNKEYHFIYIQRGLIFLASLGILIAAILLRNFLPYQVSFNQFNVTMAARNRTLV